MYLKAMMQGQTFTVSYFDRYLRTPLGCMLTAQFIRRLTELLDFRVDGFYFKGSMFRDERNPYFLSHNFQDDEVRNEVLAAFAEDCGLQPAEALTDDIPHYRYFEFESDHVKVTIRPDAGIAHGWHPSGGNQYYRSTTTGNTIINIGKKDRNPLLYTVSIERL
jgi:hypothetical protein